MIQKLADGRCWMLDNLALNPVNLTYNQLFGTGDDAGKLTNANDTTLSYFKNGGGTAPYTNYAVTSSWENTYTKPVINTDSIDIIPSGAPSGSLGRNKVGIYYNYCAASAGSFCPPNSGSYSRTSEDICPYGWHMPTSDSIGEFNNLYTSYSSDVASFMQALSTPLSGNFVGTANNQGTYGVFWSTTHFGQYYNMGNLYVSSMSVKTSETSNRTYGYSVRCIKST